MRRVREPAAVVDDLAKERIGICYSGNGTGAGKYSEGAL